MDAGQDNRLLAGCWVWLIELYFFYIIHMQRPVGSWLSYIKRLHHYHILTFFPLAMTWLSFVSFLAIVIFETMFCSSLCYSSLLYAHFAAVKITVAGLAEARKH